MNKDELVDFLYLFFYDKINRVLDLRGLNFEKYNCDIDISNMKVNGSLFQGQHEIRGTLDQDSQQVSEDLFQSSQEVGHHLYQSHQTVHGSLRQDFQFVEKDLYVGNSEVKGKIRND